MNSARGAARVIVVGGGVLGTMHAVAARSRGFEVVHLEREPDARGATVRNFGLVWVSGRAAGPNWTWRCAPGSAGRRSPPKSRAWGSARMAH